MRNIGKWRRKPCKDVGAWSKSYYETKTCYRDPNNKAAGYKILTPSDCTSFTKTLSTACHNIGSATCKSCILKWIQDNHSKESFLQDHKNWFLEPVPYYLSSPKTKQRYELMRERQMFVVDKVQKCQAEMSGEQKGNGFLEGENARKVDYVRKRGTRAQLHIARHMREYIFILRSPKVASKGR